MSGFHPGLLLILAAFAVLLVKGKIGQLIMILTPILAITGLAAISQGDYGHFTMLGQQLLLSKVDKLSLVFAYVFVLMGLIGMCYSLHHPKPREHSAAFLYMGGALGVVFAGDYLTLFVFWELMAFSSAYLIFSQGGKAALGAGARYLLVHIAGGLCLLAGIVLHYQATGSLLVGPMQQTHSLSFYLILTGFLLNAAAPPLNAWLTDAYPEATVTGAVFMCAFTTKTAIYVLLRVFPGTEMLIWLGTIMAIYGVVFAVLENDCRRLLAYHIVSQVGYMVAAVGIGTELAINGATAHAFAHILYKGLLFMGAGAVIYVTGKRKLTDLGGLYKTMPITLLLYMVGAVSISALPLFSGFVSKSMVVAAAELDQRNIIALLLMLASSGTFLSVGLKLPYYMFFAQHADLHANEPPLNMRLAMAIAAIACLFIGLFPASLYALLPYPVAFQPYTTEHVIGTLSLLVFTAVGFFLLLKHLTLENTLSLDTDWFYRKGALVLLWFARFPLSAWENFVSRLLMKGLIPWLHSLAAIGLVMDKKFSLASYRACYG